MFSGGSGCRKAERQIKGMPNQKNRPTSARAVRTAKRDNIIDCFCRALPNGVHSVPAVGRWSGPSCGGPARSPSSPPSCRPAQAGLRRGFGRRHSVWRACWPVPPHFALAPDVVCNATSERQKARRPSWPPKQCTIVSKMKGLHEHKIRHLCFSNFKA